MNQYYNNELQHFGVKGMKWGVRRYQKKDGSLTNAGKKRYSDSNVESDVNEKIEKKGLTDKQKKTIKRGAKAVSIILASGVAGYGIGKLQKHMAIKSAYKKGRELGEKLTKAGIYLSDIDIENLANQMYK